MIDYSEIQNAFLDGMNEVYSIMFTDQVEFRFLDVEQTKVNVYQETTAKVYSKDPILLVGRVVTTFEQGEKPVEAVQTDAVISIPTKQLILNGIPHDTDQDLETLKKGKFTYRGIDYVIDIVSPTTLVADVWQVYKFSCRVEKKSSR